MVEIRRNDPDALRPFAELNIAWIRDLHWVEPSDQRMFDHPETYQAGRNSVFSAWEGGEVIGVCALKEDAGGRFELTKMAVGPAARGKGVGAALMEAVETHARDVLGQDGIYLLSNTKNAAALRLYRRCGWTEDFRGAHPQYGRCNIGMSKRLDGARGTSQRP